jgi:hypothetical protein
MPKLAAGSMRGCGTVENERGVEMLVGAVIVAEFD